jgi:hypothetical protein
MNDDFDDLDRALFALPLDEPPAGLRESILRATIGADLSVAPAFSQWEIALVGALAACVVWLAAVLIADKHAGTEFTAAVTAAVHAFADPATLLWLSVGAAVALAVTLLVTPRLTLSSGPR